MAVVDGVDLGSCLWVGIGSGASAEAGGRKGKGVKGGFRLRVGSWNIGSLLEKSIEPVKILRKRCISIACLKETKWVGTKARVVEGYKVWYSGSIRNRNGLGILVDEELRKQMVEVKRVNNRMMSIKLVIGELSWNIISAYALYAWMRMRKRRRGFERLWMNWWGGIPVMKSFS